MLPDDGAGDWTVALFELIRPTYGKTPYKFGAEGERTEGPSEGPWDCAGFVMEAFDRIGIDIDPEHIQANTNAERLRQACNPVDEPLPGDLVFFEGTYPTAGASHVGIVKDPVNHIMIDDHDRRTTPLSGPGETDYMNDYWKQYLAGYGRVRR